MRIFQFSITLGSLITTLGCNIYGTITEGGIGISGVVVELSGDVNQIVTTDGSGNYVFRMIEAGNYRVTPIDPGHLFYPEYITVDKGTLFEDIDGVNFVTRNDFIHFQWGASAHGDTGSESFTHWDEDGEIPIGCAKCHSTTGFLDFIADGTVDNPSLIGETIECLACHTDTSGPLQPLTSVMFPSCVEITGLGAEAICMQCHQGRKSAADVANYKITDIDSATGLTFQDIHYYAAGATLYGSDVMSGYEYAEGGPYEGKNLHMEYQGYDTCTGCHYPHSLELRDCTPCHLETHPGDFRWTIGSTPPYDWDQDGNKTEGMSKEVEGLEIALYDAIKTYATDNPNLDCIVYSAHDYPYFFVDQNCNGAADPGEAIYTNQYNTWSVRLLRAAYNYQVSLRDPGGYAHNPKYILQLLTDSIDDLNYYSGP